MLAAVALPHWFLTRNLRKPTVEMERIVRAGNLHNLPFVHREK